MEYDRQVGVPAGDGLGYQEAALAAVADAEDDPAMLAAVSAERLMEIVEDLPVGVVRDFGHFEYPPRQLVAGALLLLGLAELFQSHPATVVGRSDADLSGRHARPG